MQVALAEAIGGAGRRQRAYLWSRSRRRGPAHQLTISEAHYLRRWFGIDQGSGLYAKLLTLCQARLDGDPTYSLGHVRRIRTSLILKGWLQPLGATPDNILVCLLRDKQYPDPSRIPACDPRRIAHLGWDTSVAAERLARPYEAPPPAFVVEGYPVSRSIRFSYPEDVIRRAVAEIKRTYAGRMEAIKTHDRLLWFMCRLLVEADRQRKKGVEDAQALAAAARRQRQTPHEERLSDDVLASIRRHFPKFGHGAEAAASAPREIAPPATAPAAPVAPVATQPPTSASAQPLRTVADALRYLARFSWGGLDPKTRRRYLQQVVILERGLGELQLAELRRSHLQDYSDRRIREGIKPQTVRKEFGVLRQALGEAVGNRACPADVLAFFPKVRAKPPRCEGALSFEQYLKLRAVLPPIRQDYLDLAVFTGARHGELERLERKHFDLGKGTMLIPGTKTDGSHRTNPIPEQILPLVKRSRGGRLLAPWGNVRRDLALACKAADVPRVSSNDLRRTFVTWLLERGVPEIEVKRLVGHGRCSPMVAKVYAQLGMDKLSQALKALPRVHGPP